MNLLPFVCADYRLIHLLIPMLLYLRQQERVWADRFFAVVFSLLLIPKGYLHFDFDPAFHVEPLEASESVVVHPLLMLGLTIAVCISVLRQPQPSELVVWARSLLRRYYPARAAAASSEGLRLRLECTQHASR